MRAVIVLAVLVLLAGCTAGADSTPSPSCDIEKYTLLPEPHWEACDDDD